MARHRVNRRPGRRPQPDRPRIYGTHAVLAVLANPERVVHRLLATRNAARRLESAPEGQRAAPEIATTAEIDRFVGAGAVHQGLAVETEPLASPAIETLAGTPLVVVLDHVTDPQNVGAVLRSAAAFGAGALVMTERHGPAPSAAMAKAASGALEHVSLVTVANLARALETLGQHGFERIGLDGGAEDPLEDGEFSPPVALVLGAEDKGLRRLTREHCDRLCRLTTPGPVASLNVSNAAAVALHAISTSKAWSPPPRSRISRSDQ